MHQLAGIEAVREQLAIAIERNFRQPEDTKPQEIRTAWKNFPPVISNGKLGDLKNEPEYPAAKAGDVVQSALLVEKLLKAETVQEIKNLIGDNQPILVPIQSEEASGKNLIPRTTARALGAKLGLQVDTHIYQSNAAKRTDSGIYHRYVSPPEFKGEVQTGKSYLIVDDTLSVGGTIAALKGYIENNGGKVIGSMVMTAHALKVDIPIQPNMLQSLQQKQGLNEYWKREFGYGVDKLTQQEAGHLRKPTLEQIQERVEQAKLNKQNKELNHEQTTQSVETRNSEIPTLSNGAGSRGVETAPSGRGQISQSVFQQPQPPRNEEIIPITQAATSQNDVADSFSEKETIMKNTDTAHLDNIRLNWSESSLDTDLNFKDLDSLQAWFKQNNPPETIPQAGEGYNKTNITLFLTDDNGEKHEITERIDVSVTDGDFNPNTTHIAEYPPLVELLSAYGIEQEKAPEYSASSIAKDIATETDKTVSTAKAQYESKLATLPTDQQQKARFYEQQAFNAMQYMPAEFHEKTQQAIYENQIDLIHDGKYHAPDVDLKPIEYTQESSAQTSDWEIER